MTFDLPQHISHLKRVLHRRARVLLERVVREPGPEVAVVRVLPVGRFELLEQLVHVGRELDAEARRRRSDHAEHALGHVHGLAGRVEEDAHVEDAFAGARVGEVFEQDEDGHAARLGDHDRFPVEAVELAVEVAQGRHLAGGADLGGSSLVKECAVGDVVRACFYEDDDVYEVIDYAVGRG